MANKEDMIRAELRSLRDLQFRTLEWGITVMVSLSTAIWHFRAQTLTSLIQTGQLPAHASLPWDRYLVGTSSLLSVALIFTVIGRSIRLTAQHYRSQLAEGCDSGIRDLRLRRAPLNLFTLVAFFFPLADVLSRIYVSVSVAR
jgi:hypothetical protein